MNDLVREAKQGRLVSKELCIKLGKSWYLKEDYSKAMLDRTYLKIIGKPNKEVKNE